MGSLFRQSLLLLAIVFLLLPGHRAMAVQEEAVDLVRKTTSELLEEFNNHRTLYESDKNELYAMVEHIVIPYFDFDRMTKLVLGRYSRSVKPAEFEAFKAQFKTLLIRTYATALFQYTGQKIRYSPQINEGGYNIVRTSVQMDQVDPVKIEYFLAQRDDGLKVFDVSIDGISLVTNYRSSYNSIIHSKGLQALIDALAERNSKSTQ